MPGPIVDVPDDPVIPPPAGGGGSSGSSEPGTPATGEPSSSSVALNLDQQSTMVRRWLPPKTKITVKEGFALVVPEYYEIAESAELELKAGTVLVIL